jgi:heat shock protein HslJ
MYMTMMHIHKLIPRCVIPVFVLAGALHGEAFSASSGPEGIDWRLVEVGGTPVSPLPNERQPNILLDPVKKRVSGFSGCNNFFGGYELDGPSLKFGLIGSTRRACPDLETALETDVFKALDETRAWNMEDSMLLLLLLLDDGVVLARFTRLQKDASAPDLGSITFLSTWFPSGKVTLSHGEYREPAAPGSASEIIVKLSDKKAFGMVNGREIGAAVIVTSGGGTGTFYDLALLSRGSEGWVNTDTVFLGDRVKVHSVEIKNNRIVVAMTTHGPKDPKCCPTFEVKKRFAIAGNHLVSVAEAETDGASRITGTVWQCVQTLY